MKELGDIMFNATRRHFLAASSLGIGSAALASLVDPMHLFGAATNQGPVGDGLPPGIRHVVARAKRVIYLFQSGGPSQFELFDHKPTLQRMNGDDLPESVRRGQRLTGMTSHQKRFPLAGAQVSFARHGASGAWVSELMPHTARIVDDLCFVKSMHTEAINHDPAATFVQTGSQLAGRPWGVAMAAVAASALALADARDRAEWALFFGRFHPLFVHMPIGGLLAAALPTCGRWFPWRSRSPGWASTARPSLTRACVRWRRCRTCARCISGSRPSQTTVSPRCEPRDRRCGWMRAGSGS